MKEFKTNITSQDMYFNKNPLPANETGKQAYKLCNSVEGAIKFCPKRWETLQKWFKASREVIYTWAKQLFSFFPFVWLTHNYSELVTIQFLQRKWMGHPVEINIQFNLLLKQVVRFHRVALNSCMWFFVGHEFPRTKDSKHVLLHG